MSKLNILNSREVKKLKKIVIEQFGYFPEEYVFLENEKNRIFLINRDLEKIDLTKLRVDKIGLYLGEYRNDQLRLSKEGSQLLVLKAQKNKVEIKNIVKLSKNEVESYFTGSDLEKDLGDENKLILLGNENNILGCARYKNGVIINFLPKIHRGTVIL